MIKPFSGLCADLCHGKIPDAVMHKTHPLGLVGTDAMCLIRNTRVNTCRVSKYTAARRSIVSLVLDALYEIGECT